MQNILKQLENIISTKDNNGNITISETELTNIYKKLKESIPLCDIGTILYVPKKTHWIGLKIIKEPYIFEYVVNKIVKTENGFVYETEQGFDFENEDLNVYAFFNEEKAQEKILEFKKEYELNEQKSDN